MSGALQPHYRTAMPACTKGTMGHLQCPCTRVRALAGFGWLLRRTTLRVFASLKPAVGLLGAFWAGNALKEFAHVFKVFEWNGLFPARFKVANRGPAFL